MPLVLKTPVNDLCHYQFDKLTTKIVCPIYEQLMQLNAKKTVQSRISLVKASNNLRLLTNGNFLKTVKTIKVTKVPFLALKLTVTWKKNILTVGTNPYGNS